MKVITVILVGLLINCSVWAQDKKALEKIERAKIALITSRLGLSSEQAEKFWPLYHQYTQKRQKLRKEFQQAKNKVDLQHISEQESQELLRLGLEIKEQKLALDKEYANRMSKVISSRQLLELRRAEDDFRKMLLKRLERRRKQGRRGNF